MKTKHAFPVILSFVTVAAMAVPAPLNHLQYEFTSETSCAQHPDGRKNVGGDSCNQRHSRPIAVYDSIDATERRIARDPQSVNDRKNKILGLMAILVAARSSQ